MALTTEQRRINGRKGGLKRAQQFTPEYQSWVRSHVSREALVEAGKKGYRQTARRHGEDFAANLFAEHRRKHPSPLEQIVIAWLDDLHIRYTREFPLGDYFYDFRLPDHQLLIEVDSLAYHGSQETGFLTVHGLDRTPADAQKTRLAEWRGYTLLRLQEPELHTGEALNQLLAALDTATNLYSIPEIEPYFPPKHPFAR